MAETFGVRGDRGPKSEEQNHWHKGNGLDALGLAFKPGGWDLGSGPAEKYIGEVFNVVQYYSAHIKAFDVR